MEFDAFEFVLSLSSIQTERIAEIQNDLDMSHSPHPYYQGDWTQHQNEIREELTTLEEEWTNIFNDAYDRFTKNNDYFYGCPFEIYKNTYPKRLNEFLSEYSDAEELDFIEEELKIGILNIPYFQLDEKNQKRLTYSLQKRFEFLKEKLNTRGITIETDNEEYIFSKKQTEKINNTSKREGITFNFKQTELVELTKALIDNKNIQGTQVKIFEYISEVFNTDIKNTDQKIQHIKGRNIGSETIFLDILKNKIKDLTDKK